MATMDEFRDDGADRDRWVGARWRRSSACGDAACVEVARHGDAVAVRDAGSGDGPLLEFTAGEWRAFLTGAKAGEFDL
jgi:hypothetical protein